MRFHSCIVANFGSYEHLSFEFNDLGLALVHGATGSGKSTLQDIPCWVLWAATAKNGSVEDVRSWFSTEPTYGSLVVETKSGTITVERVRGKPTENDLYWIEEGSDHKNRGKDLNDTQKLLNKRLGVDFDLYSTAAYFNEFSPTANFFLAKAKDRRQIMEKVANLDLPKRLAEKASNARKDTKERLAKKRSDLDRATGRLDQLLHTMQTLSTRSSNWGEEQAEVIERARQKSQTFEEEKKKKIEALIREKNTLEGMIYRGDHFEHTLALLREESRCSTCGALRREVQTKIDALMSQHNENSNLITSSKRLDRDIEQLKASENVWLQVLEKEKAKTNPLHDQIKDLEKQKLPLQQEVRSLTEVTAELERTIEGLSRLYDLSFELRGAMLQSAVSEIEEKTNENLEKFFDSEFRVSFALESSDDLEVTINKSGNPCFYRQLSKGQRSLLRLCFVVAVMGASANKAGVHFSQLLFDEALDGLDSELKVKAHRLFESLSTEHETVLVIDHSEELKALFSKRYHVKLINDVSEIEEET